MAEMRKWKEGCAKKAVLRHWLRHRKKEVLEMTEKEKFRKILFQVELLKRRKVQVYLRQIGLTPGQGQARILMYLSEHKDVTQKQLSDECLLDVTTMSRVLDRMEKMGLIIRERDPGCRRAYRVSLTGAGEKKADEVKDGFHSLEEVMCRGISPEEIRVLADGLAKVAENLRGTPGEKE